MSDTPRTDECLQVNAHRSMGNAERESLIDFARTLERELADARAFSLQPRSADTLDAERYRYLRDAAQLTEDGPSVVSGLGDLFEYHWGAEVDEVVDEAIAEWKAKGSPLPKAESAKT